MQFLHDKPGPPCSGSSQFISKHNLAKDEKSLEGNEKDIASPRILESTNHVRSGQHFPTTEQLGQARSD